MRTLFRFWNSDLRFAFGGSIQQIAIRSSKMNNLEPSERSSEIKGGSVHINIAASLTFIGPYLRQSPMRATLGDTLKR